MIMSMIFYRQVIQGEEMLKDKSLLTEVMNILKQMQVTVSLSANVIIPSHF